MYLEDDKDLIIGEDGEVQLNGDEDLVSWDEVLDDVKKQNDDIVSIKNSSSKSKTAKEDSAVDLGDDLELVDTDDEVDDEKLRRILDEDDKTPSQKSSRQNAFDAFGEGDSQELNNEDTDLDLDNPQDDLLSYSEDIQTDDIEQQELQNDEPVISRKEEIGIKNAKGGVSPVLIALLFFLVVAAGVYYYMTFFNDNNDGSDINSNNVQQNLDNATMEEIQNRNKDEIDVVNEENIDEIKPDQKQDDKTGVLTIVPTGRVNPFMPIGKFVKGPEKFVAYDKVSIPKPPAEYGKNPENIDKLLSIAVSGIMYDPQKPSAIITYEDNDYFVQKGDRLDDYKVVEITKNSVMIALGKNVYRASVGEEFKISNVEGSAQFLNSKQGGGRLYHSVSSEESSDEKQGYVSPLDVEVKAKAE